VKYFSGEWDLRKPHKEHLKMFSSLGEPICVYDLGASGGTPPPFCWFIEGIRLINFEPDSHGVMEESGRNYNIAIGPRELKTLYINRRQTTSSLLPPFDDVVSRYDFSRLFPEEPRIFETISTVETETLGLDDAVRRLSLSSPDFLKIDVQGLTLEVLETGRETLAGSVLGLQTEVEFIETYKGQKTFGAVHEYLEKQHFEIFRFSNLNRWPYKTSLPLAMYTGQDVFCDLLYLRSLSHVERHPDFWTSKRAANFIRICLLYDLTDTAAAFLEKFIAKRLIDEPSVADLARLIRNWTGALDYFYHPIVERRKRQSFLNALSLMLKALLPDRAYNNIRSCVNQCLRRK
jgi:FkbM family methyltransferase